MPVKVIKSGMRRIFNTRNESTIINFFKNNPDKASFDVDSNVDLNVFCGENR